MGIYFVMSTRFNRNSATDFGLEPQDSETAINPKDGSIWKRTQLYDLGWGKENGFYKLPLPQFDILFELVLHSECDEDVFGAAAIILEKYPDLLLEQCEVLMNNRSKKKDFKKLVKLFNLKLPINRCPIDGKSYDQIQRDYTRWKKVSEMVK